MCGIAGYLGSPHSPASLDEDALLSSLRHRGPDEQGRLRVQARDGTLGQLVSSRLAIVDLSPEASQPMRSLDGRVSLSFNGEIYNHPALRAELLAEGARFQSSSDTEVILVGYAHWGDRLWPRLRGMFALALWDAATDELRLLRDPMGQKPLYLCHDGPQAGGGFASGPVEAGRLCFASELRVLLNAQAVPRRIDPASLAGFLTWGSVPEPRSVVDGVQRVPAGHLLRVRAKRGRVQLDPPQPIAAPSAVDLADLPPIPGAVAAIHDSERAATLRAALAETLAGHLQGDVPIGILLSGGVDSTCVAAWARHVAPERELLAFTLATGLPGCEAELAQARATAQALRLRHHIVPLATDEAADSARRWLAAQDQPSIDGGNTFLICEQVHRAGCKVVLSGMGGDELFLGYGLHRRFAAAWAAYRALPAWLPSLAGSPIDDRAAAWLYLRQRRLFPSPLLARLMSARLRPPLALAPASADTWLVGRLPAAGVQPALVEGLALVQRLELQNYLRNTLLLDGDALSMAHSVELRLPLCDPWLWRRLQAVRWLDSSDPTVARSKRWLVEAAPPGDRCVLRAAQATKRGFDLPIDTWLHGPLRRPVDLLFSDESRVESAGLCPRSLRWLWSAYLALPASLAGLRRRLSHRIWALYVWLAYVQKQALLLD
jgi:asparagine synthase (glutamine-hydrolysing)